MKCIRVWCCKCRQGFIERDKFVQHVQKCKRWKDRHYLNNIVYIKD